ncbi:MAG: ThuA domain-containing protein [Spirochaetes bacterium]|nr:ThuA domain-containing protein [Spirochaetota bacterium]
MPTSRIAALIGDDYHEPGHMRAALEAAAGADVRIDFFTDPLAVPWGKLSDYGVLVMAREGRMAPRESKALWNTERHEQAIAAFVRAGGSLVGLHAGLASYAHAGPYGSTLHGTFFSHPEQHPEFRVRSTGAAHVLLEGFSEVSFRDEMYFMRVDSADTTRLLESSAPDYGSSTAAWAHECGAGRVFCFTPGHRREVLEDPSYRRFLAKGIQWVRRLL